MIVTRTTRTRRTPASDQYLVRVLNPAQIGTPVLRATLVVDPAAVFDPKLACEPVRMSPTGVLPYAADYVQCALLAHL